MNLLNILKNRGFQNLNLIQLNMISLWNYYDKFDFRETQKQLNDSGSLEKYILFSNNAVESFTI